MKFISWKIVLLSIVGIGFLMDIFEEGLMSVGIILGWLIGLMTANQWEMEHNKYKKEDKGELK